MDDDYIEELFKIETETLVVVTEDPDHEGLFWLHSHGMVDFGLAEIEIRQVHGLLVKEAMNMINRLNAYRLKKDIKVGETFDPGTGFVGEVAEGKTFQGSKLFLLKSSVKKIECGCQGCNTDPDFTN
jgi:hypothetical protein